MGMIKVGAFEAKTHLSELLEKVKFGANVLITKRGHPVACLVPADQAQGDNIQSVIDSIRSVRSGVTLQGLDWKDLRDEGRR